MKALPGQSASRIPMHWLQALRGQSVLFTRDEALTIIGQHWADVVPEAKR